MFENYYDAIGDWLLPMLCTTPCVVHFNGEGLNEDGGKIKYEDKHLKCLYQCKISRNHGEKGVSVSSSGACYFVGDILPESELLEGKIEISNIPHAFKYKGEKLRDNKGKVIYTLFTLE